MDVEGTALAVTGAEVATTVTAGTTAAVAIGAIATDSVASMAMMGRTIGVVATRYGCDVQLPYEELFAVGVLSLGVAGSSGAKTEALAALSRLTQQMMRQATWRQLNEHLMVRAIGRAYQMLGLRLTQRKLAQTVPFVGGRVERGPYRATDGADVPARAGGVPPPVASGDLRPEPSGVDGRRTGRHHGPGSLQWRDGHRRRRASGG